MTFCSCVAGVMNADYSQLSSLDPSFIDNYTPSSLGGSILANRVSYHFNLHGPSVTLDTACSSGAMSVHLGAQSVLTGIAMHFCSLNCF